MTTTDTDALTERIARALYENAEYYGPAPTQPPWDWRDDEERGEWIEIAAAVLPIIAAEVRKAKAEALRQAADWLDQFEGPGGRTSPYDKAGRDIIRMIRERATEHETGDQ